MIKVGYLSDENSHYSLPDTRAALFGHAALDYFRACALANEHQWRDGGLPFFNFLLPTMHQTLELASKAIALKAIDGFNPKARSHRTLEMLSDYASDVPVFASVVASHENVELLRGLQTAYLGLRYGECYSSYEGDTWPRFVDISTELFDDLSARTGLRFPMAHRLT